MEVHDIRQIKQFNKRSWRSNTVTHRSWCTTIFAHWCLFCHKLFFH